MNIIFYIYSNKSTEKKEWEEVGEEEEVWKTFMKTRTHANTSQTSNNMAIRILANDTKHRPSGF